MARSSKHRVAVQAVCACTTRTILAPMELSRQADAVNLDWATRYRRLAGL
jgi:hypothetical protein